MRTIISNDITLLDCPAGLQGELISRLTIANPKYAEALERGRYTGNIPRTLRSYSIDAQGRFHLPRGFGRQFLTVASKYGVQPEILDQRRILEPVEFTFEGSLRDYQEKALADVLACSQGVLQAGTGAGKTVMAISSIAARKQPTLILVHTKELLDQWIDRIEQFLGIDAGRVGGGKFEVRTITVATVQTARKHLAELAPHFGFLIVDECHRTPSTTFLDCVSAFDCKFMLGLSATPYRRDKLTRLIYLALGDRVHEVDPAHLRKTGAILAPEIVARYTDFDFFGDPSTEYSTMISALAEDPDRNRQIATDVLEELRTGSGTILLVSDRVSHLEAIASILEGEGKTVAVLTGQTPKKRREAIVDDLAQGKVKILASTTSLIGEGFDAPGLASLFLCTPIKFSGRLIQVVGRILRPKDGKRPRLYDYVDKCGVLRASAKARARVYRNLAI
jgi:superfamily II DNA or RNA helicase